MVIEKSNTMNMPHPGSTGQEDLSTLIIYENTLHKMYKQKNRYTALLLTKEKEAIVTLEEHLVEKDIVLMDREQYVNIVQKLHSDNTTSNVLNGDPTEKYLQKMKGILNEGRSKGLISEEEKLYIFNAYPTISTFLHTTTSA